jgi:hypothetical protein
MPSKPSLSFRFSSHIPALINFSTYLITCT